ncbi:MAG: RdgB/HAM1 family non-canonical purine NTP pyrophosphatase [Oribacterium sp.]|nr:RdgB/HAM1 family non-canonical purine NTP pyrophosphatase [Oribacterium sp.]MBO6307692.1 RdgB/HAM1 family non-canonical purine NTP pyrophosphatase [Oribacterium sp.]MBP3805743.1 RdgB/HAM1 family non-canonical purine NTP pyrophosphatase [Oribacterium sp.]MBR1857059.1 RdgB/HAM1 family non-canonical purine NTP pyrophosphatase [Oribacterium sp.]
MRIIFATHNKNKMKEIRQILGDVTEDIVAKSELGIDFEPVETGKTFAENAELKASGIRSYMLAHDMLEDDDIIMSDDSGLCVNYMLGMPGIYSARYLGEDTSYDVKNARIIHELRFAEGDERAAHFACSICAVFADGRVFHTEGKFEGLIAKEPKGTNGFGYDPILYLPEYGKTSAELTAEEKNSMSHRGKALRAMRELLKRVIGEDKEKGINSGAFPERKEGSGLVRPFQTALIVSDSHRKDDNLKDVLKRLGMIDYLIHLGDSEGTEHMIKQYAGDGVECYFVQGNNDFFTELPREQVITLGKHKCFLTHGHYYGVGMDLTQLTEEAKARGCDIAMFGHTHRPYLKDINGVTCINPGSISYPRQSDRRPSYMVVDVSEEGELTYHQVYLKLH